MKYFLVVDTNNHRHIVCALSNENLLKIIRDAELEIEHFCELESETFNKEGFLISDGEDSSLLE